MPQNQVVNSNLLCLKSEEMLDRLVGDLDPSGNRDFAFNAMRAIEDSQVGTMIETNIAGAKPGDTSCPDRHVDIRYVLPDCTQAAVDCSTVNFDCTDAPDSAIQYENVRAVVEDCVAGQFSIDTSTFQCNCDDWQFEFSEKLRRTAIPMFRTYQQKLTEKTVANVGTSYDGVNSLTTPKPLKLYDAAGRPQAAGLFALENEYMDQAPNSSRRPYLLSGSDKLRNLVDYGNLFRGNDEGLDFSRSSVDLQNLFYDREVARVMQAAGIAGDEQVVSWMPGSIQVLDWYLFRNELLEITPGGRHVYAPLQSSGTLARMVMDIGTPLIGRPFLVDAEIRYDECNNKVHYKFKKEFDLWCLPQNSFCSTYNYKMLWNIVCEDWVCDDTKTPDVTAINPLPA